MSQVDVTQVVPLAFASVLTAGFTEKPLHDWLDAEAKGNHTDKNSLPRLSTLVHRLCNLLGVRSDGDPDATAALSSISESHLSNLFNKIKLSKDVIGESLALTAWFL